jgi:hypothetical protein
LRELNSSNPKSGLSEAEGKEEEKEEEDFNN